ncbi:hypothetical protein QYF36_024709 [Acer negundo]|nr:hypothetical protein QYF36_024709 [Acer negundo]
MEVTKQSKWTVLSVSRKADRINKNIACSSILGKLWKEKRHQKFAHDLAVKLIENDKSWEQSIADFTATPYEADKHKSSEQSTTGSSITTNEDAKREEEKDHSPLFAAAKTGNTKLVKMILKEHPQALEYKSRKMKQNILHVAVKYRQKEIFKYVKSKRVPMLRLVRQIDEQGYTILHSVADTKHYIEGTGSGPAYQLQEELEWFNKTDSWLRLAIHVRGNNHVGVHIDNFPHHPLGTSSSMDDDSHMLGCILPCERVGTYTLPVVCFLLKSLEELVHVRSEGSSLQFSSSQESIDMEKVEIKQLLVLENYLSCLVWF